MKILVINAGSSSIKYQLMELMDVHDFEVLASGLVEKIGEPVGRIRHKGGGVERVEERRLGSHREGLARVVELLCGEGGVIGDTGEVIGVGHRVLNCGEVYSKTVRVDGDVKRAIRDFFPLGPLHNPANLMGMEVAEEFFPKAVQVAVFDTAFHGTMPAKAFLYATPYRWYKEYHLRKYGFHGTSHKFITRAAAEWMGHSLEETDLISLHLGNGCSMAAVRGGKCVDTTMGVTPLEGLMMGTRSGDVDATVVEYIMDQTGMDVHALLKALNKESGLRGICGRNDMREVVEAAAGGDRRAELALEMFAYRAQKYIGAYMAVVPGVQALVFTGGIGENSAVMRGRICGGLRHMGVWLDEGKNGAVGRGGGEIQEEGARVKLLVLPTNEELQIALETKAIIEGREP